MQWLKGQKDAYVNKLKYNIDRLLKEGDDEGTVEGKGDERWQK